LLLHCKLEIKKNARVIDFSGVFEFLYGYSGDYIHTHITPILTYLTSSLQTSLQNCPK